MPGRHCTSNGPFSGRRRRDLRHAAGAARSSRTPPSHSVEGKLGLASTGCTVASSRVQDDGFGLVNLLGARPAYGVPKVKSGGTHPIGSGMISGEGATS